MIRGNDWSALADATTDVRPGTLISVIIPAHCSQDVLDLCVASLLEQTVAKDDLEVVIVDHRSEPALRLPEGIPVGADVSLHRLDSGFGPGAARAFGATRASGEIFVFIDVDIIATHDMVRQYALLPSHDPSVVSLGFREFVDPATADLDAVREAISNHTLMEYVAANPAAEGQEWSEYFLSRAEQGLLWRDDLWVIVVGAGVGVSRSMYALSGGFRDFPMHGVEDTEFGWRLFQAGAVIAPNRAALGAHWGLRSISVRRDEINHQRAGMLSNLIAHNRHRVPELGRTWSVPKILVQVVCRASDASDDLVHTCHDLLRSAEPDLIIDVHNGAELDNLDLARSWLDSEPRVAFIESADAGVPESTPFTLRTFAGIRFVADAVPRTQRELDQEKAGVVCVIAGADLVTAELWRTAALARASFFAGAEQDVRNAAREAFDEKWVPGDRVGIGHDAGASDTLKKGGRWVLERR